MSESSEGRLAESFWASVHKAQSRWLMGAMAFERLWHLCLNSRDPILRQIADMFDSEGHAMLECEVRAFFL